MKLLFLLLIQIMGHSYYLQAQIENEELKKYSYPIYGFKGMTPMTGTGFFIKRKGNLYLITAKHVLSSCRENGIKVKHYPDTMNVYVKFSDTTYGLIEMDIREIRDTTKCLSEIIELDAGIIKLDTAWNNYVNSVERFIAEPYPEYDKCFIWGYPFHKYVVNDSFDINVGASLINFIYPNFRMTRQFIDSSSLVEDSLNYIISSNGFEWNKIGPLEGFSGSPVFLRNIHTNNWQLVGILIKGESVPNKKRILIIARIEMVLKMIDELN